MRVSLVIPCFDEAETLPRLLVELEGAVRLLEAEGRQAEVICVDDGSRDGSAALLAEAAERRPWLRVLCLARNYGQTAALAAGFHEATGEVVVALDADLQNDPADIPVLLRKLEEGYDVVSGWRRDRHDSVQRTLPSRLANWLACRISGVRLHDFGCTLKAYRREVLQQVRLYGEMHRFIPLHAALHGARIAEVPVRHHPRRAGRSKYGLRRVPAVILDVLFFKLLWSYGTKPLHVFGAFAFANLGLSLLSFAAMVWFKLWGGKPFVETPLPLLTIMFFLLGCFALLAGFTTELVMRTWHEASGTPTYVVRRRFGASPAETPPHSRTG